MNRAKETEITINGRRNLDATLIEKNGNDLGILFLHGMTSSKTGYKKIAKKLDFSGVSLAVSLGGHGKSEGGFNNLTVTDLFQDSLNAYDFLRSKLSKNAKVIIVGSSVGGSLAALVSSQRTVDGLVLRAPATYTDEMLISPIPKLMEKENQIFKEITNPFQTKPIQSLKKFEGKLLIIPSEFDQIIPKKIPEDYSKSATEAKHREIRFLIGAPHGISGSKFKNEFIKLVNDWLENF